MACTARCEPGERERLCARSPSRLTDFAGLAPAFIDVGELDIFRDESITAEPRFVAKRFRLAPGDTLLR